MITKLFAPLRQVITDRYVTTLTVIALLLLVSFCLYIGFHIHVSEIQVVTHYSAFGVTNFYHDRWYYLLTFVGFGVIIALMHTLLIGKLLVLKGRAFALAFGWFTITLTLISWIIIAAVLRVAFPL